MATRPEARLLVLATLAALVSAACVHRRPEGTGSSVPSSSSVPTTAVIWRAGLSEAFGEAGASGCLVFVEAYRDDCYWCERLDDETLSAPAVVARLARFACVRIDPGASRDAAAFVEPLGLSGYPTMYVFDASGTLLGSRAGFAQASELAAWLGDFLGG